MGIDISNIIWLFDKGGVLMYPLTLMSIVSMSIIIERIIFYCTRGKFAQRFVDDVLDCVKAEQYDVAIEKCKTSKKLISDVLLMGLQNHSCDKRTLDEMIEKKCNDVASSLSSYLQVLSIIVSSAPMLGFLGTIIGLIRSFMEMSNSDVITPNILASGLYEAMLTTAAGLMVSIIADLGFRLLVAYKNKILYGIETQANSFINLKMDHQK